MITYLNLPKTTKSKPVQRGRSRKLLRSNRKNGTKQQEKRNKAKEERARQREIRAAQPKPPRASRAKKTKVLASSILPNTPLQPHMHHVSPTLINPLLEGENIPLQSSTSFSMPTPVTTSPFYSPIPMHYFQPSIHQENVKLLKFT